jgi:hypothetical protein
MWSFHIFLGLKFRYAGLRGSSKFPTQGHLACLSHEKEVKTFYIKIL